MAHTAMFPAFYNNMWSPVDQREACDDKSDLTLFSTPVTIRCIQGTKEV